MRIDGKHPCSYLLFFPKPQIQECLHTINMSHGYFYNGLTILTFSLNNKSHHNVPVNMIGQLDERKISTVVKTCNMRIKGWAPWSSITLFNKKISSLLGNDYLFSKQYPIMHDNQSTILAHKLKSGSQTITFCAFSPSYQLSSCHQLSSPICLGLRISQAIGLQQLTLSIQTEGTKAVTIDAMETGDP